MKKIALSKTAAVVVLGLASLGAQAAEVVLNFDELSASIRAGNSGGGAPVAVGSSQVGFLFSGAHAYDFTVLSAADSDPTPDAAPPSAPVFIANKDRVGSPGVIELSLLGANVGRAFKTVAFNYFVGQSTPTIEVWGAGLLHTFTFTPGHGPKPWLSSGDLDLSAYTGANLLKFSGSNSGLLGLDSIAIDFISGSTGGGTVPEPASFGLVALALLGAGVASRRRKPS